MFTASLKSVLARKLRLALTVVAVMLGVTFITGTLVLTDTSNRLFDEQFAQRTEGVDLVVRTAADFDQGMGIEVERDPVTPAALEAIRAVAGVGEVAPSVQGQALLVVDGSPVVPSGPSIGGTWQDAPMGAFGLREGRPPTTTGEVVIDAITAGDVGVEIGDAVGIQTEGPVVAHTVVGIAGFGDADGIPNATVALLDLAAAQELIGPAEGYTQVSVLADGVSVDQLRGNLAAALGDGYEITTAQDLAAASAEAAKEQVAMLRYLLAIIAVTALVVGAFLIANTFSILLAQRTREFAMLRAVGATGRQVTLSVIAEAAVIGLAASVAGTGLGVVAGLGLRSLVGMFGVELPSGPLVIAPRTIIAGIVIGTLVTVLAATSAARRAARVAPVQAMRGSAAPVRAVSRKRLVGGGLAVVLTIASGATIWVGAAPSLPAVAVVGVLAITALGLLGPAVAGPVAALVGHPLARLGVAGRLARDGAARAPRRTAATVTALAVGLAVVAMLTTVAASFKHSVTTAHDEVIRSEYIVESARGEMLGGLSPHIAHDVGDLPEVAVASRLRFGHWKDGTTTQALTAVDPATLSAVADIDAVAGSIEALGDGGIVLSETVAEARGLGVGDELPMSFSRTGTQRLRIVGLIDSTDQWALRTGYVISHDTYARYFTEDVDAAVLVKVAEDVDPVAAGTAIERALAEYPTADLRDHAEAKAARTGAIDKILGLVTVLLVLAVGIALLGITNTLALSIVERTRELGLLRAVGMTRPQLRSMVRGEALLVAVLGAVVGTGLGLAMGATAVRALAGQAVLTLAVPAVQLGAYLAVVIAAGLAAGVLPARRAARTDVLTAIASE